MTLVVFQRRCLWVTLWWQMGVSKRKSMSYELEVKERNQLLDSHNAQYSLLGC